ncbi:sigma 54-interacting transcriptional regulator [Staphylospora marina]|uniref:sigma 54-interacting transcriptional regulator n=1 Tax=Staphylospora marina TaxID=2490858 RepID=UPI0013DDF79F|nr:sigma 54-interacting transcriptional regulator [Staphylospora marina]
MNRQTDRVLAELYSLWERHADGVDARMLAARLRLDRSTVSRYLNELVRSGAARKMPGRPVRYVPGGGVPPSFGKPAPADDGLTPTDRRLLNEAMAALLYPPNGLPILLTGETGSGKSWLAQLMTERAASSGRLSASAPFVPFNCAEYAHNPELLLSQLFGVKKGAFTGADADRPGLVERASGGVLFLDEVHRLPPAGQEMLFTLIDRGTYRRLGETENIHHAAVRLVAATTEPPERALIPTLLRRFSTVLKVPALRERPAEERFLLLGMILEEEARKMGKPLELDESCRVLLLRYDCPGNIGQLKGDVRIACARAFLRSLNEGRTGVRIRMEDLPAHVTGFGRVTETALPSRAPDRPSARKAEAAGPDPECFYAKLASRREELMRAGVEEHTVIRELEKMADRYVRELIFAVTGDEAKAVFPDAGLLQVLRDAADRLDPPFSGMLDEERLTALTLHLQAFLEKWRTQPKPSTPVPLRPDPRARGQAQKLADHLLRERNIRLPDEEIDLISYFFASPTNDSSAKPRTIAVVCLTGEGAARSVAEWLKTRLPAEDSDVTVRSVPVPPSSSAAVELEKLAGETRLVAVTGTVNPDRSPAPFLPVWELYGARGMEKLHALLSATRQPSGSEREPEPEAIPDLLLQGLRETVVHFNPDAWVSLLKPHMEEFRRAYEWDPGREAGVWMHLAIFTDRLLDDRLRGNTEPDSADPSSGSSHPLWSGLLDRLERRFAVRYPPGSAEELHRLSESR